MIIARYGQESTTLLDTTNFHSSFGRGSPMQRSRQFDKHRAETAAAKAVEYRVEKLAWKNEKVALVVVRVDLLRTRFEF